MARASYGGLVPATEVWERRHPRGRGVGGWGGVLSGSVLSGLRKVPTSGAPSLVDSRLEKASLRRAFGLFGVS